MRILYTTLLMFICFLTNAQTIPNAGFETWLFRGSFYDPEDWYTYNGDLENAGIPPNVNRSSDAHSGSYAIALKTIPIPTDTNSVFIGFTQIDMALNVTLSGINGFYKYNGNNDTGYIYSRIFKRDANNKVRLIREGFSIFTNQSNYTPFNMIFYNSSSPYEKPDSCFIYLVSGNKKNTVLTLDDLSFGAVTGIQNITGNSPVMLYPNPSEGLITGNFDGEVPQEIIIRDVTGKDIFTCNNSNAIDISALPAGVYSAEIKLTNKTVIEKIIRR
ncbi:MAG: T9SS type A sorting domain-containing protein [Bacteroidia bacterium]|nr:T9SS type A sorting domain-containing protein [Bacteroidia bacterium]